jgi:hypothetical protein
MPDLDPHQRIKVFLSQKIIFNLFGSEFFPSRIRNTARDAKIVVEPEQGTTKPSRQFGCQ